VAGAGFSTLACGETGVGKEVVVRQLHPKFRQKRKALCKSKLCYSAGYADRKSIIWLRISLAGNVRKLQNVIRRLIVLGESEENIKEIIRNTDEN
jgi:transcriptional regulator with PAS, ATPase and Fis domain